MNDIVKAIKKNQQEREALEKQLNEQLRQTQDKFKPNEDGQVGNIGDWSEIYVFYRIMEQGKINTADKDMNLIYNAFLPVLKIIREESDIPLEYYTANAANGIKAMKIYHHGVNEPLVECALDDFKKKADDLLKSLKEAKKNPDIKTSSLSFPDQSAFLNDIFIRKIKAPSKEISSSFGGKSDITMEVIQQDQMHVPVGFSIKSALGANSSLINASKANDIIYRVQGCDDKIMHTVNSINTKTWVRDRVRYFENNNIKLTFETAGNERGIFLDNMRLISDREAEVVAYALLFSCQTPKLNDRSNSSMTNVLHSLIKKDPLAIGRGADVYYKKRLQDLLFEYACGMQNDTPWNGSTKIQGGYIFVTKQGDVLVYYASDQDSYKDWLLNCTKFDMPSTSRHEQVDGPTCGYIHKTSEGYFFTLSLNVKFKG